MSDTPKFKTFRDLRSLPTGLNDKSSKTSITSIASNTSPASITSSSGKGKSNAAHKIVKTVADSEISPTRDFQKIPNSVPRSLDMFRGKSKQVWDYLWHISRGSINPVRKIRKSRKEIKEGSALGSMVTVDAAIEHLINVQLLKVNQSIGSQGGNEYEIFTPEEVMLSNTSSTSISSIPSNTSLTQKVVILDIPESGISSITQPVENKHTYTDAKTFFKDNKENDDESGIAFSEFLEKISAACRRITGKPISKREREKWGILADLLILELETAARRADSISSAPSFLTEVLRRKLLGGNAPLSAKQTKTKIDTVGKPDETGEYEKKPLDEKGREEALAQLQEFADDKFLEDFEKWYSKEDWKWLISQLEKYKKPPTVKQAEKQ